MLTRKRLNKQLHHEYLSLTDTLLTDDLPIAQYTCDYMRFLGMCQIATPHLTSHQLTILTKHILRAHQLLQDRYSEQP